MRRINMPLYLIAGLLFGLKTYVVYRFVFHIELDNFLQKAIILYNPFMASVIFFSLSIWFKSEKKQMLFIRYTALIGSIVIYFNLLFHRSFTDFLTIPQLFQMSNALDLGTSIISLIKPYDFFIFVDLGIIWYMTKRLNQEGAVYYTRKIKRRLLTISIALLCFNFVLSEIERPQLLTRAFDREYLVKNMGLFYYHIYDVVMHSKLKTEKVFADGNELKAIKSYIDSVVRNTNHSELFGVAKGRNIIFISAESMQSFVIGNEVDGQEITPFLNELANDEDTYYFENFYHQTGQGKTSDSEFIVENSLYPSSSGAVFFTHSQNEYHALPEILEQKSYKSVVLHANNESFWNRNHMYESLNIDYFYDKEHFNINEENTIGWGLKDKPFFEQSIPYLRDLSEPFYAKLITLTNHFPFELDEVDQSIEPYDSTSMTLNNYFPTVRYMDEAIESFFMQLKTAGLYDNAIIVIMGDHEGISANHNKAMSQYLNKEEITPYDEIQLQRVPFFIHIPGHGEGRVMNQVSGQIDVKPTLLHLIGIETTDDIYFGNDLFLDDRKSFIALRNGDFISDELISTGNTCLDRVTGQLLGIENEGEQAVTPCTELKSDVETELQYSDNIIHGDLFRFIDFKAK